MASEESISTGDVSVVVIGSANTDYVARGSKLPGPGETASGENFEEGPVCRSGMRWWGCWLAHNLSSG